MNISAGENIQMAFTAVWTHRFRSLLTILGIVIGITTVVTVASLLTGLRKGVVTFFEEFGPDNMFIYKTSGDPSANFAPEKERRRRPLKPEYAETLARLCQNCDAVGLSIFIPSILPGGKSLSARVPGFESDQVSLVGASPEMQAIQPRELRMGRYYTADEDARGMRVAMLGSNLADALFPDGRALGQAFLVDGAEYIVVGVFAKAKGGFFGENGIDRQITIPLKTARSRYPQVDRFMITVKSKPNLRVDAFDEVEATMRRIRRLQTGIENDFSLSTPDQIIKNFDKITALIGLVAIAISALGLLVGGIGVMNIMLVSVTERTKEIGVRKAIGARKRDIIGQFLVEAMALTGAGGALGILFSVLVTLLISALVPALPSEVPSWAVASGLIVSVSVGLFFGTWPAVKAANLDPVEALRYE